MEFFGEIDRNYKKEIKSQYPAWTQRVHIDKLQESIADIHRRLENHTVPSENIQQERINLARFTEQLERILASRPKPNIGERQKLQKIYRNLSEKITEALFTRSEMQLGLADAHEEARRMVQPLIQLDPEELELAESCNVKITKKKVSRNDAAKMFKIIGHLIDEPTNIEVLRGDGATMRTGYSPRQTQMLNA